MSNKITLSSYTSKDREWLSNLLVEQDVRRFLPHLTTDVDKFICGMKIAENNGLGKFWIIRLDSIGIGFRKGYSGSSPEGPPGRLSHGRSEGCPVRWFLPPRRLQRNGI